MEEFATQYFNTGTTTTDSVTTSGDYYLEDNCTYTWPWHHYTYTYPCYHPENKKERAYEILKVLVKEEMIKEPKSFKKFCDLIEKIAEAI